MVCLLLFYFVVPNLLHPFIFVPPVDLLFTSAFYLDFLYLHFISPLWIAVLDRRFISPFYIAVLCRLVIALFTSLFYVAFLYRRFISLFSFPNNSIEPPQSRVIEPRCGGGSFVAIAIPRTTPACARSNMYVC